MTKIFYSLFVSAFVMFGGGVAFAAGNSFSCGDGYIKVSHSKVDGMETWECQKLWCRDLETNKPMGSGDRAASGYVATTRAMPLEDWTGKSITCFGDRKWCSGEVAGEWNKDVGGYTRRGDGSTSYKSFQRSGCFAWRLEKPNCKDGEIAILQNNKWKCVEEYMSPNAGRAATIRRTGAVRRK